MDHGHEEGSADADDLGNGSQRAAEVVNVHQRHFTDGPVEMSAVPPCAGVGDVSREVVDSDRLLVSSGASDIDQPPRDINANNLGAPPGHLAGRAAGPRKPRLTIADHPGGRA